MSSPGGPVLRSPKPKNSRRRRYGAAASGRLAPAANVARLGPSVTAPFNVKSQRFAEPQGIRIDACGLQRADVQKYIRTARVVLDETQTPAALSTFQKGRWPRAFFPPPPPRQGQKNAC